MARRGPGEGSVRERKDGRWEARVLLTGPDGRRRRRSLLARTQKEAREKLQQALRVEAGGLPHTPARLTVSSFLDQWLRDVVEPKVRPSTLPASFCASASRRGYPVSAFSGSRSG